jgi:hypothetical protein
MMGYYREKDIEERQLDGLCVFCQSANVNEHDGIKVCLDCGEASYA